MARRHHSEYRGMGDHLLPYFDSALLNGCAVWRRFKPLGTKEEAIAAEERWLSQFDYPWNALLNGRKRYIELQRSRGCLGHRVSAVLADKGPWLPPAQYEAKMAKQRAWQVQLAAQQDTLDRPDRQPLPSPVQAPPQQKSRAERIGRHNAQPVPPTQPQQPWQQSSLHRQQQQQDGVALPKNMLQQGTQGHNQERAPHLDSGGGKQRQQNVHRIWQQQEAAQQQQQQLLRDWPGPSYDQAANSHAQPPAQPKLLPQPHEGSQSQQSRVRQLPQSTMQRPQHPKWWQTKEKYRHLAI